MFDFNTVVFAYFIPIIFTLGLLIFWRKCTVWRDTDKKFPTRFHILSIFILSLIPIIAPLVFLVILFVYIINRTAEDIKIKPGKHSKFWFDIDDKDKDE